jgi:hypothetical protein
VGQRVHLVPRREQRVFAGVDVRDHRQAQLVRLPHDRIELVGAEPRGSAWNVGDHHLHDRRPDGEPLSYRQRSFSR